MADSYAALYWILVEAGATHSQARHLESQLDKLRLNGWGSDDLADLMLRWRNKTLQEQAVLHMVTVRKLQSAGKWKIGLPDADNLFKQKERTGG